jgi:hypothetical protein
MAFVLGFLAILALALGLSALVIGLYSTRKRKVTSPTGVVTTTATATTPAAPPPAPRPASKWVWWLAGVIVSILVITILWRALPTISVPTPGATESSIGKFLSSLDLSGIPFAQSVVALVGATWAPIVLIVTAVILIAFAVWILKYHAGALVGLLMWAAFAAIIVWGVVTFGNKGGGLTSDVDLRRHAIGETKPMEMSPKATALVSVEPADVRNHGFVYKWACPTLITPAHLKTKVMFKMISEKGSWGPMQIVLTSESQKLLEGYTDIKVLWTVTTAPEGVNPCLYLKRYEEF